jgi:hypothetical protein
MVLFVALGALSATGCLIAEAPDYGEPRRTTPVIDSQSVDPPPYFQVKILRSDVPRQFTMTVRSEDARERLRASLVIDYEMTGKPGIPGRQYVMDAVYVPARAADEPKKVTLEFLPDIRIQNGCHSLTALVMHDSSATADGLPIDDVSDGDVASVTWWIELDPNMPGERVGCPEP